MMKRFQSLFCLFVLVVGVLLLMGLTACFTGVEGTKRIELSKSDRRAMAPSPEKRFADSIGSAALADWLPGRRFVVTDNRLAMVLLPHSSSQVNEDSLAGHILLFESLSASRLPDGSTGSVITFGVDGGDSHYDYPLLRAPHVAAASVRSGDLPMMIDLEMVDDVNKLLSGRKLWTRSQLWYASDSTRFVGQKFVPVTVDCVLPGNSVFPLKVVFTDAASRQSFMFMNLGSSGLDSRSFDVLFSLSDPKLRYPRIEKDVWALICDGKVRNGMTKEECRLSLGTPDDVDGGRDWSRTLDIWKYSDGKYLVFSDGLLSEYRL